MTFSQGNSKNIIVGAAAVFISNSQANLTDFATVDATNSSSAKDLIAADTNWQHSGYTDGGVEVSYEPTYGDVTVDQLLDSAVIYKTGMKVMVNTTFSEATLENLLITWGAQDADLGVADADGNQTLDIDAGSLGAFPHERGVAFVGQGPRTSSTKTLERIYWVQRAIQTSTTAHKLSRDAATTLPVSFRCLPGGASGTTNSYGQVQDRAYTAGG